MRRILNSPRKSGTVLNASLTAINASAMRPHARRIETSKPMASVSEDEGARARATINAVVARPRRAKLAINFTGNNGCGDAR